MTRECDKLFKIFSDVANKILIYNDDLSSQIGGLGDDERRNFVSSDVYKKMQLIKKNFFLFQHYIFLYLKKWVLKQVYYF